MSLIKTDEFLPFAAVNLCDEAIAEVVACLKSGWLTTGPRVKKFEGIIQDYLGSTHTTTMTSATAGLHLAMTALNLKEGDEVITTSFTFVATLNTIVAAGGRPVLVDINPGTLNMNVDLIEQAITSRTKAIMPVHFAGLPVDMDPLLVLAEKYNLHVVEDAAHAIGTSYKGRKIGSFGMTQVFSFHPNKNITTGEGGALTTIDKDLFDKVNIFKFHGINRDAFNRFAKGGSQLYDVVAPGYKYNMTDIQASLGIHQLPRLDSFIEKRTALVKRYYEAFKDWSELVLPGSVSYDHVHAWHLFTPLLNVEEALMNRNDFIKAMGEKNIGIGLHWQAPSLFTYYQDMCGFKAGDFPNAEKAGDRIISLPLFPHMTESQQDRVIQSMKEIFKKA